MCQIRVKRGKFLPSRVFTGWRSQAANTACARKSLPEAIISAEDSCSSAPVRILRDSCESLHLEGGSALCWAGPNELSVRQDGALAFAVFHCIGGSAVGIHLTSTLGTQIFPDNWAERNPVPEREQLIKRLYAFFWCQPRRCL